MSFWQKRPLLRYTIKRLLELIPTTLGVLLITFILFHVVGSSSAEVILGQHATQSSIDAFNARYGYNLPLIFGKYDPSLPFWESIRQLFTETQLFRYISSLAKGDLGESVAYGMRVADVLKSGIGPSLTITVPILFGGTIIALMLSMVAATQKGKLADKGILLFSTLLMSVNYVVWILLSQYFLSYKLRLFPIWGYEGIAYLILPVTIGIFSGLGKDIRYFRTVILDETSRPYVRTAIAKALPKSRVFWVHVFPNALIPVVTYISLSIPYLFTGSLLLESFFGIPGLGGVSINAINSSDMATVRAIVILGSLLYQLVNLLVDLSYAVLDPRVRMCE